MKRIFALLMVLLCLAVPGLAEDAPLAMATLIPAIPMNAFSYSFPEGAVSLPEDIPAFDPASIPSFPESEITPEEAVARAKALWQAPLFRQDVGEAPFFAGLNDREYSETAMTVRCDLPNDGWTYVAFSMAGDILRLDAYVPKDLDAAHKAVRLTHEKYTPAELRGKSDPTAEERVLLYFLDFSEFIDPVARGRIESVHIGASYCLEDEIRVEIWAKTPDTPFAGVKPGENERYMELMIAPEWKVLCYGPSRG